MVIKLQSIRQRMLIKFTEYSTPQYNANDTLMLDPAVFEKGDVFSTDDTTYFYVISDKGFALRLIKKE